MKGPLRTWGAAAGPGAPRGPGGTPAPCLQPLSPGTAPRDAGATARRPQCQQHPPGDSLGGRRPHRPAPPSHRVGDPPRAVGTPPRSWDPPRSGEPPGRQRGAPRPSPGRRPRSRPRPPRGKLWRAPAAARPAPRLPGKAAFCLLSGGVNQPRLKNPGSRRAPESERGAPRARGCRRAAPCPAGGCGRSGSCSRVQPLLPRLL